jgi:hypothetical protein
MVVAVFVAPQAGMYGAMLFVSRFLATNARMGVVVAVAIQVGKYGARPFVSRFLATNARMGVAVLVAPKPKHSCIRGFLVGSY